MTAASASETDRSGRHPDAEQRDGRVALSATPGAAACLFDQRLLLAQRLDRRAVAEIVRAWRAQRNANSHTACRALAELMDDSDQLVGSVAVSSGEVDEFPRSCDYRALFGRAGDGDASAAAELEQSLVA